MSNDTLTLDSVFLFATAETIFWRAAITSPLYPINIPLSSPVTITLIKSLSSTSNSYEILLNFLKKSSKKALMFSSHFFWSL